MLQNIHLILNQYDSDYYKHYYRRVIELFEERYQIMSKDYFDPAKFSGEISGTENTRQIEFEFLSKDDLADILEPYWDGTESNGVSSEVKSKNVAKIPESFSHSNLLILIIILRD